VGDNVLGRVNNWPLHRPESACFISRWGSHWPRLPSTGAKPDPCGILEYPVKCLLTVRWERLQSTESHGDQKPLETCEALFTSRRQEPRLPLSECSAAKSRTGSKVVESCSCRGSHISNQVQFQRPVLIPTLPNSAPLSFAHATYVYATPRQPASTPTSSARLPVSARRPRYRICSFGLNTTPIGLSLPPPCGLIHHELCAPQRCRAAARSSRSQYDHRRDTQWTIRGAHHGPRQIQTRTAGLFRLPGPILPFHHAPCFPLPALPGYLPFWSSRHGEVTIAGLASGLLLWRRRRIPCGPGDGTPQVHIWPSPRETTGSTRQARSRGQGTSQLQSHPTIPHSDSHHQTPGVAGSPPEDPQMTASPRLAWLSTWHRPSIRR
jgi:hypothetical protein